MFLINEKLHITFLVLDTYCNLHFKLIKKNLKFFWPLNSYYSLRFREIKQYLQLF